MNYCHSTMWEYKKKKGITRWENNLGAPSGPGKKNLGSQNNLMEPTLALQTTGLSPSNTTPAPNVCMWQECTLQLFCTQSLIKEIKKAQRLASKLEPETSGMEEASITTTPLEDLRLDTVSNLLKHSTLLKQKSAPTEMKNNTCVTHFLFLIQD